MLPDRIDAFLLDLDGTLVDTEPLHWLTAKRVLEELGVPCDDPALEPAPGWGELELWCAMRERFRLAPSGAELAQRRTDALVAALAGATLEPLPGAIPLLEALDRQRIPRLIVSASPRDQVAAILGASGLAPRFAEQGWVSGHEDAAASKPAPDPYRVAARRLGVAIGHCVAVEDSLTGMTSALAAGAHTVVVPSRDREHPGFSRAQARFDSLVGLARCLSDRG